MTLVITSPPAITAAYNPIIIVANSNVRDDGTIGPAAGTGIDAVTNTGGYATLTFLSDHGLLLGGYIKITSAPGQPNLVGIALITKVVSTDTIVINKPYPGAISSAGIVYRYISNYNAQLSFYIYVNSAPNTPLLAATKTVKPRFASGFCLFEIDVSGLVRGFNYNAYTAKDVLTSDLYPITGTSLHFDKKSFVKWGFEIIEAFDGPIGGIPEYQTGDPAIIV